ncbi:hypothetical protein ATANTOWER_028417 [Ataeniobius toweri]|uniref:Uncharacterized protein n=1 Tax=Ataeniobius toweri TaxID=208326 RepID=A0ABU7ATP0_9TELE|nr:hypothetical protein [Ataeniobius toweri]
MGERHMGEASGFYQKTAQMCKSSKGMLAKARINVDETGIPYNHRTKIFIYKYFSELLVKYKSLQGLYFTGGNLSEIVGSFKAGLKTFLVAADLFKESIKLFLPV